VFAEPPPVHRSPVRAPIAAQDLLSASLVQSGTELRLTVRLRARPADGDLCLRLRSARLCVGPGLVRDGSPVDARVSIERGTVRVVFTPAAVHLPLGRFTWSVETSADRIPATGAIRARAALFAAPRCFGAAARDPWRPCRNPALRTTVTPTPSEALLTPNAPCRPTHQDAVVSPCVFGLHAEKQVALIGDSHAEHWRAALEVVAQAKRWRGISITQPGCAYNALTPRLHTPALTRDCARWQPDVRSWLGAHPEVHTVFVSAHAKTIYAGDAVAGFRAAWRGLPESVKRVYVLRDTPRAVRPEAECVSRRARRKRPVGSRCAQPRAGALPPDPEATAARGGADPRVRLLDLSALMCGADRCPAVIGGVLVRKDGDHLTRAFSATLGRFVLRAIRTRRCCA
jgi:SGNH domain (fused to AT3 domains)